MYIASARQAPVTGSAGRIAANVLALGSVSLVTDISSEMVTAVLPLYLVLGLGFSPLQFGLLDGLYTGVGALVRVVGGGLADRWQRRKLVAGFGYGLSCAAKLGLLASGGSAFGMGAVLVLDRTGKGIRTAPRDALISLSSTPSALGRSFGVHRAMDTVGAFLGPLVAFCLLWTLPGRYDTVFVVSFLFALFGVVLLILFVRDRRGPVVSAPVSFGLLRSRPFRRLCLLAVGLGLLTLGDGFVFLLLQKRLGLDAAYVALLPLGTAGVYLLLAVPLGGLADRVGRWRMFVAGHVALLCMYVLLFSASGVVLLVCVLVAHGVFYAATDGVLMAAAGPLVPAASRTSGLAVLQTAQALARMCSSLLVGAVWTWLAS
ncbi:MFS transporter [Lentzea sp. NBRC 105346]|uniref:MFS transporter n=1 Tax=Lentzea sp. NBRC 105346 TaxID=3032205 RepID=UPI0024A08681|nr:MFS transporter [Lentzea sp. NBRC 105346]GLZ28635.1 MFS transporter [Lentzea sp. NBRC 105346]